MIKQKFGFTLAEVLIVIGIIGVVAALTLPNLNHATGDKEKVTKVKKIYSTLNEAFDRAQAIYGPFDTWFKDLDKESYADKTERGAKRITEFLKVSKDCGNNNGCFSDAPLLYPDGDEYSSNRDTDIVDYYGYTVILSDGTSVGFQNMNHSDTLFIYVDTDGPNKGKNMLGDDSFTFYVRGSNNALKPLDTNSDMTGKFKISEWYDVYVWAIYNDNLDYLKCPNELNWETKTSCE